MPEMISVEQARDLVLSHVSQLPAETVPVLDAPAALPPST